MTENLNVFFKENNTKIENVEYIVSNRFKDNKGNPIKWKIKILSTGEMNNLREHYTTQKLTKGILVPTIDNNNYMKAFITKCIVYPNLNDKALQDSYNVYEPYELLEEMLTVGEFNNLVGYITDLHDYNAQEVVDDIKKG
ncbi:hypothetical protein QQA45_04860 [Sneathia sanguinegens]|uniref:Phage XkdN-like protein n=1 Tax=Sneathia sanguinegens TaxID=40543 RepID=A0ABT7HM41_9FUSO|nr:hypothetical protein [Sneathia sanguinegens]MDK9580845.1 hypothetical protein [Sneathia sanguinegens]DAS30323.1 MAG TPA: tail assembly chaperone protein [Caudoviricetes sp.]